MAEKVEDLTDKEKEALRLLLDGHDTKSSASELGISVHTVNDRLRNARRKLGVSSSREAARILRDAEGGTPQNPAHTSFGIAGEGPASDTAILTQDKRAGPIRFTWLAGGMLIMSILIAAAVLAVVSGPSAEVSAPEASASQEASAPSSDAADAQSLDRAEAFLAEVDQGDWSGSWDAAGEFFQSQTTAAEWAATVDPVRSPLGSVESRELASVQQAESLPGAPEGDYEVLQFETKHANREDTSIETVIMIRNGDGFDVAGYFIR